MSNAIVGKSVSLLRFMILPLSILMCYLAWPVRSEDSPAEVERIDGFMLDEQHTIRWLIK